jgi:hypothetical protein
MKKIVFGALALLMVSTLPAVAQTYHADAREFRQESRIYRGIVRGDLTRAEAGRLIRQQRRIDRAQAYAARHGFVSLREKRKIERMQDRASRNIFRMRNDHRYYL